MSTKIQVMSEEETEKDVPVLYDILTRWKIVIPSISLLYI